MCYHEIMDVSTTARRGCAGARSHERRLNFMKLRRMISGMMALLLVCSLPLSAFADTWYLDKGSITVEATQNESGGTTQIVSQKISETETTSKEDANPTITQHESVPSTENTVTIEVETGAEANVTIQDVNIVISDPTDNPQNHSGEAAVTIVEVACS